MDLYTATLTYLLASPVIQGWPEAQSLLQRTALRRPFYWQLPVIACAAVGGAAEQALPGMAATACLHTSLLLLDDLLDADPKGEYHHLGQPATANLAAALQALGLEAVTRAAAPLAVQLAVLQRFNQMTLTTALGQYWDVQTPQDEAGYWRVVDAKSAPFFGAALAAGALLGGATAAIVGQLEALGRLYGAMIQLQDDLSDVMATPADPDWLLGRAPLPILYAQTVDHPARAQFCALRQAIAEPAALAAAQLILIRSGAISYATDQLLRRYGQAQALLAALPAGCQDPLAALFERLMQPVQELLAAAGASPPAELLAGSALPVTPAA